MGGTPRVRIDARATSVVAVLAVLPLLGLAFLGDDGSVAGRLVPVSSLIAYTLVLGSAVLVWFHWRLSTTPSTAPGAAPDLASDKDLLPPRQSGWLCVGLVLGAAQGLLGVAPALADQATTPLSEAWSLGCQAAVLIAMTGLVFVARRTDVPADPAVLGGSLAVASVVAYVGLSVWVPVQVDAATLEVLDGLLGVFGAVLAVTLLVRMRQHDPLLRRGLAGCVLLLVLAHTATCLDAPTPALLALSACSSLVAAGLLSTACQTLLRSSVTAQRDDRPEPLEIALPSLRGLNDRELIHEVGATVAGIATASRVIRQTRGVDADRRARLEEMVAAELSRLERLLSARAPIAPDGFDVDDALRPVVVSQQARGLEVTWSGSDGLARCEGDPDDLAELVAVLLQNARTHAPGSPVELRTAVHGDEVRVTVSDVGPGVAPEHRERIFLTGERASDAPGHGLGLPIARRLAGSLGGSLELDPSPAPPGATFVVRLPLSEARCALPVA